MSKVASASQWQELQSDLNKLACWAEKWQMKFNVENCKVLHIGNNNVQAKYLMKNVPLACTEKEVDLRVLVLKDLKSRASTAQKQ